MRLASTGVGLARLSERAWPARRVTSLQPEGKASMFQPLQAKRLAACTNQFVREPAVAESISKHEVQARERAVHHPTVPLTALILLCPQRMQFTNSAYGVPRKWRGGCEDIETRKGRFQDMQELV